VDSSSTGSVPFAPAWTSPALGGDIYAQPLIYEGLVLVATESNDVYALSESTGRVIWHANAGTPVPAKALPCGDIVPTVGITSTPVIDPATGTLYAVADLWNGSQASHWLLAFDALTGRRLWSEAIDPAGSVPEDQLQRAALNLSTGRVLIGFGGNSGDCGTYWGWLQSVSESTHAIATWQAPTAKGDAIWAAGGPAVDGAGNVYAATGNGASFSLSSFDYGDSLLKFSPTASPLDYFAPASWASDSASDLDLGSASPELLSGGLVYQDGKNGNGYLVSSAALGHFAGQLFQAPVCASYGADAYSHSVIYVACAGGIRALSLDVGARRFVPLWLGPASANGPPILAGGLVWVTAYNAAALYGLRPATGQTVVTQPTPPMEHFTGPSASDGKLFLATGQTVEAYGVAKPLPPPPATQPPAHPSPPFAKCACGAKRCRIRLALVIPGHTRIVRAYVYVGRKRVAASRGRRLRRIVFRSPAGQASFTLRLVEVTSRHHRRTFRLKFRDCRRVGRR
jgi:outer membrane protein assembly factor BamB